MLIKFAKYTSGESFRDVYVNPNHVLCLSNTVEWVGQVKKHFHVAGITVIHYALQRTDGDPNFDQVIGTLDEVAAKLNAEVLHVA